MKKKTTNLIMIALLCLVAFSFQDVVYAAECPLGPQVTKDLYGALKIFRILAPIFVVVLSTIDAIKALTKGDGGADLKKVAQRFGKRAIYAVILFFIPVLVDLLFQMTDVWGANGSCNLQDVEITEEEKCSEPNTVWNSKLGKCVKINESTTVVANGKKECDDKNGTWHDATGVCIESCSGYISSNECNRQSAKNKGCKWISGKCTYVGQ